MEKRCDGESAVEGNIFSQDVERTINLSSCCDLFLLQGIRRSHVLSF